MNKRKILPLIILDVILIAAATAVMIQRYRALACVTLLTPPPIAASPIGDTAPETLPAVSSAPLAVSEETAVPPAPAPKRNIGFVYFNARARRVMITGEFTGWKRVSMKRGKGHKWAISFPLESGSYAYNFFVDGKIIKDPNNPRSCSSGRGFLSSSLTVEPLTHETVQPE